MKVDTGGYAASVDEAAEAARRAERLGYDSWWCFETKHDPFLGCAVAAERTETVTLGTSIAVAFARNPMTVAVQANDVQALSGGRFVLGLGTQIKPHIEKRYSMEWSHPAPRMREFVLAVRAIWEAWASGGRLDFRGDFYTHTLMTPFFDPGPNPHGNPKLMMAAVGPLMTEAAGEVADGMFCHAFCTERYLREVTLPALQRGAAKAGRTLEGFEISAPSFVVAADTEEQLEQGIAAVRAQIGFYGSTPAYRPVLEAHGWGELQEELNTLTKRGAWDEVAGLIDDEILHTFAVIGTPEEAVEEVRRRYADVTSRVTLAVPEDADPVRWAPLFERLREPAGSTASA
ncbi:MAG TPA: TIGR03617 family F420-dependent LLM class oxidoreductase [Solirubrobacteraceae bacterium]|nr:TIGR03617 family F420-dependent LLM class oxidoreductase [Solirubrobacteraceae bacterium]